MMAGLENPPKHAYVVFEWSLSQTKEKKILRVNYPNFLEELLRILE